MSDKMRQIPFGQLIDWALCEYKSKGSVFGVRKFYSVESDENYSIFGESLELPFGPAAGPHTQLAQNLIASYVSGARFFELKTVQVLDGEDLPVSKPCISAKDECYNVEWSTELYVPQALEEYIKGWLAIIILSREIGLGSDKGFVFNMSVGYDLDGIKTDKINNFIEGLKNAENTECFKSCMQWLYENLHKFEFVDKLLLDNIGPKICDSITLSTLHGCPPAEIERIASYLLTEKRLHTFIKCNPTLLGYEYARETMDKLGFDYLDFDDRHFKADLQFDDAVPMLQRLQKLADSLSLEFGVKLTNTFPVRISDNELPGEEMYMSGRSLFPLSIEVANRLAKAFDGKLRISFSGGADVRNIRDVIEAGIWPVTLATTLLKPGGYQRLRQITEEFCDVKASEFEQINLLKLQSLVNKSFTEPMYHKPAGMLPERKISEKVPLTDCFIAPCMEGCPFGQDVPAYLRLVNEGKYIEALRVITERNPLPFITGTICSHRCMTKCTRSFYDHSVGIRSVKLKAAMNAFDKFMGEFKSAQSSPDIAKTDKKTAIIGGGPAGIAAAYFLARAGCAVTIFEKRDSLGGIVRHVIPEFRIHDSAIDNDIKLIEAMGVDIRLNTEVSCLTKLRNDGYESIIIATGAWTPGVVSLENGSAFDALEFLAHLKHDSKQENSLITSKTFGKNIAVIGGGNTAMDTARAAKRIEGVENVSIVYRRTKRYMPADVEELMLASHEGIHFYELLAPKSHQNGNLTCTQMILGEPDSSGRRSPVETDKTTDIPADTVIAAVGNKACKELCDIEAKDVFVIGDAANGPSTVAEAIRDAMKCAETLTGAVFEKYNDINYSADTEAVYAKKGILYCDSSEVCQSGRCLECRTICENCVDVCPNRANITVIVDDRPQIVHIDFMCNECGNCEVFCPYESAPYLDKLTLFISEEDFKDSKNNGFMPLPDGSVRVKLDGNISEHRYGEKLPVDIWKIIKEVINLMRQWVGY
ncbi:MAG: putative selenate reductase subunit YgfK [Oscillospiraceae bacterium]|nr:putative selenate reductase subunit YgfK [Oscillospiraceae bacterium]